MFASLVAPQATVAVPRISGLRGISTVETLFFVEIKSTWVIIGGQIEKRFNFAHRANGILHEFLRVQKEKSIARKHVQPRAQVTRIFPYSDERRPRIDARAVARASFKNARSKNVARLRRFYDLRRLINRLCEIRDSARYRLAKDGDELRSRGHRLRDSIRHAWRYKIARRFFEDPLARVDRRHEISVVVDPARERVVAIEEVGLLCVASDVGVNVEPCQQRSRSRLF